jgi:hypothetical protein
MYIKMHEIALSIINSNIISTIIKPNQEWAHSTFWYIQLLIPVIDYSSKSVCICYDPKCCNSVKIFDFLAVIYCFLRLTNQQ